MKIYKMNNHHFSTQKSFKIALESVLADNYKPMLETKHKHGKMTIKSFKLCPKRIVKELKRAENFQGVLTAFDDTKIELEIIEVEK